MYPGDSSRKNNKARLFPNIRVLACQESNRIYRIQGIKVLVTLLGYQAQKS